MIEPQVHNGQRKTIVEQHGMAKLLTTLDALTTGQTAQQQRDTRLQEQLTTQDEALAHLRAWWGGSSRTGQSWAMLELWAASMPCWYSSGAPCRKARRSSSEARMSAWG